MVTAAVDTSQPGGVGGNACTVVNVPATGSLTIATRIVLSTGWHLVISSQTQNQQFQATIFGYERAVEDVGELQP
jgi:hypothetical protein